MTTPRHRVSAAVAQMRDQADTVADASVWSMDAQDAAATLVELTKLEAQVTELKLRVAGHADDLAVGQDTGATSTASWWAHQTNQVRPAAHGQIHLAHALAERGQVRAALAAGDLVLDQARAISAALAQLPDDLDAALVERAEAHLVAEAADHDAKALGVLGKRLLEVVAPEEADAHEARLLEREEAAAAAACRLTMADDGHGKTHGRFTLPAVQGAMLKKMLLALAAPKHRRAVEGAGIERRPGPERLGRALWELIERYPANRLPETGGVSATVVVTIDLDTLTGRLEKAGILDTGESISPGQVRRLACTAAIIPAVLDGDSEVLDWGRQRRYHTPAQRGAIALRDRQCTTVGCDWPPGLCHTHHGIRWADDGPTDYRHGHLLCPRHHARAHDPAYVMQHLPGGKVAFHRRT